VVSDLHGHVLDIPFVLTLLAVLLAWLNRQDDFRRDHWRRLKECALAGSMLAVMYMTNAWDFPIYLLITGGVLLYLNAYRQSGRWKIVGLTLLQLAGIVGVFWILDQPYIYHFVNFSKGVRLVQTPTPFYQLAVLWGYQLLFAIIFYLSIRKREKTRADIYVLILAMASVGLIYVPELIYLRDIYGSAYSRANTMFKLTYQAFILLGLLAGYAAVRVSLLQEKRFTRYGLGVLFSMVLILPLLYPYYAIRGYYGKISLARYKQLDGLAFLQPDDAKAIAWLKTNVSGQPTILEANGDSYTEYGRISMTTGLPTVLGWFVHEWLWRGDNKVPAKRVKEVAKVYESSDVRTAKSVVQKYDIRYIIWGDLERKKFKALKESTLLQLG